MRILIDARKAFDSGIGTYIRSVVPRVVEQLPGIAFSVLVEPRGAARHTYLDAVHVDRVEMAAPPLGLREQTALRRVMRHTDLFWATSLAHPIGTGLPMIATVHDVIQLATRPPGNRHRLIKAAAGLYLASLRNAGRLLLFNSHFTQGEFERCVGRARGATQVTPLGVEPAWFDAAPPASSALPPSLICIGNLRHHKNLPLLLQAFAAVKDQLPHDLVVVGEAEGLPSIDAATRTALARLEGRARFSGPLSDADLRAAVAGADALVVPSLYEGFGLPALEAMAAGVPVIAARAGALPEVCDSCARYFDPASLDALATQLVAHATMPSDERRWRVTEGITRARTYTWDETARLTSEAIAALITRGGRGERLPPPAGACPSADRSVCSVTITRVRCRTLVRQANDMNPFHPLPAAAARASRSLSTPRPIARAAWLAGLLAGALLTACGGGGSGSSAGTGTAQTTSTECQAKRSTSGQDVFLLIGQSNMVGYGAYFVAALDKTDPRIKQWMRSGVVAEATEPLDHPNFPFNAGRVGPGLAFARAYLSDLPSNRSVLLVPAAQGGSGLSDNRWNPGNDLYELAVSRTLAALALQPGNCLGGLLWSQGEIDAINKVPEATYRTALHTMIRTMRSQLARGGSADAIPFVLSQFSNDWAGPTPTADQQAILNVINGTPSLLPTTAVASTAGLTSNLTQGLDGAIHLDAASQRIFGPRYREALKVAVANGPK